MGGKSWIDETKIAIWGWSYGGYTTTKTLGKFFFSFLIYILVGAGGFSSSKSPANRRRCRRRCSAC